MPTYSFFHTLVQKIMSSKPGAWLGARLVRPLDNVTLKLTGGRATLTSLAAGVPIVYLTTIGAKSGLPRTLPLLPIRDTQAPAGFALIASNWGQAHYPAWYFNLKKNPRATCMLNGQTADYEAQEVDGEEYERIWGYATQTYRGYALYKERATGRRIPIMVMKPVKR